MNSLSNDAIAELITRRRRQILVHSCIYYRWDKNVISDSTFDSWSKELAELQTKYPNIAATCDWFDAFKEFDGSSGFDLPIHHPHVVRMAERVMLAVKWKNGGS